MMRQAYIGSAWLVDYPAQKLIVACDKCGRRVQYDKAAMLRAGGDRPLTVLLPEIARRIGDNRFTSRSSMKRNNNLLRENTCKRKPLLC